MLRTVDYPKDLEALLTLEKAAQITPWSKETFEKCHAAGSVGWVIEKNHALIGFLFLLLQAGEGHILNVCVHPDFQGQGYGGKLLQHAFDYLIRISSNITFLEVRKSNTKAINLYKKTGFVQIGERKNYYMNGENREDALVFAKNLSKE